MSIEDTLNERATTHGNFDEFSAVSQNLKAILTEEQIYPPYITEALDMIAHKLARIVCGNPNHVDHWHDIAGYATLVEYILVGSRDLK